MPIALRRALSLVLSCLLPACALAQQQPHLLPLSADPARATHPAARLQSVQTRPAALSLPFFDDFANERLGNHPDPALWEASGSVYRNNRFPLNPITHGVATLDGLNAAGQAYAGNNSVGDLDTLTSQLINLSGQQDVYLSFWWQAGGVGGIANLPTSTTSAELILEFDNGLGGWTSIWTQPGLADTATIPTPFQETYVPVDQVYRTGTFRFRFRANGAQYNSSDVWNIDYVLLDANRQPQPTSRRDVALSRPLPSALARYSAMPVWQFNAASSPDPAAPLNPNTNSTINNLGLATDLAIPFSWLARLRATDPSNLGEAVFASGNLILPGATRQEPIGGSVRAVPAGLVPLTAGPKVLEQEFVLSSGEQNPATRWNDTLRRQTRLASYYAYDDDTPENYFSLGGGADPRYAAQPFEVATPDFVEGISLFIGPNFPSGQRLFAAVWGDTVNATGQPRPKLLASAQVSKVVPHDTVLQSQGRWITILFPAAVPVSGRFWAGYGEPPSVGSNIILNVGFDLNTNVGADSIFFYSAVFGHWRTFAPTGALLMRPMMNPNPPMGTSNAFGPSVGPALWPNPVSASAQGRVQLAAAYSEVSLLDALGRPVRRADAGATDLDVRGLPAGVYTVRSRATAGAPLRSRRLVVVD